MNFEGLTTGGTDRDRWFDVRGSWGVINPARSKIAVRHIPRGSCVLDLSAGTMIFKELLSEDCDYQPCDLYSRCPGCIVADFNKGEFPVKEYYDWEALIGLFQFLDDPIDVLSKCSGIARNMAVIYSPIIHENLTRKELLWWRRGEDWNNHFTLKQYFAVVTESGWKIKKSL